MRVIAGDFRGVKLLSLEGSDTRPTLDRVKEAIFSMLFGLCDEACVLDLFAGSGGMGIEALSRGAAECIFVDNNKKAIEIIKANVEKTRSENKSTIIYGGFDSYLNKTDKKFDLVFLDPPYESSFYNEALSLIYERDLLNDGAIIVLEKDKEKQFDFTDRYRVVKEKNYGRVTVCMLEAVWKK